MKVLVTSDWHLRLSGRFSKPLANGLTTRAMEGLDFIAWLAGWIEAHPVDLILHCGDIFDAKTGIPTPLYNAALDHMAMLIGDKDRQVPMIFVPGNHDRYVKGDLETHNMYALGKAIPGLCVLDRPPPEHWLSPPPYIEGAPELEVFGVPGSYDGELTFPEKTAHHRMLVIHENLVGAKFESGKRVAAGWDVGRLERMMEQEKIDVCFCGDIHRPQQVADDIHIVGAPYRMTFGDEGQDRGFLIWEDAQVHRIRYDDGPVYRTLIDKDFDGQYLGIEDPDDPAQVAARLDIGEQAYVRFRVSQERNRRKAAQWRKSGAFQHSVIDYQAAEPEDDADAAGFDEEDAGAMVDAYVQSALDLDGGAKERDALIAMGRKYLTEPE